MLILNQWETAVINSDGYVCYAMKQESHGYMIGAYTVDNSADPVRLGWYCEKDEAKEVLFELFDAMNRAEDYYCFPEQYDSRRYHDDRD